MEHLPLMYNPGPEVTVGECLVPFRGCCSVKVYSPSKSGKYAIKIWAAYAAKSSYAWKYAGILGETQLEGPKIQGVCVVLDMTTGL